MKKAHILISLFIVALFATSCETYEDYDTERGAVIGFTLGTDFEISVSEGSPLIDFPIPYFVSESSSSERTFQVVVVAEETEVASENYSFDSMVVVPANERSGTLLFSAMDISLTNEFAPLVLAFEASSTVTSGSPVRIFLKNND
jgi:hypothetical protein